MIGCEEGVFPHSRSLEEGKEEEERRLCYVGITRARKRLWLTHARSRRMFAGREVGIPSRFLSELPDELVEREGTEEQALTGWSLGRRGAGRRSAPTLPFATGDDVVHASFGEGVVTAVEPGGVIVVRFAGDGAERKLMADYAPAAGRRELRERDGDRRQGGRRAVRERVAAEVERAQRRARPPARPGHGAGRRRPGLGDLRAAQARGLRGGRDPLRSTTSRTARSPRRTCSRWSASSTTTTRSTGSWSSFRCPDQIDSDAVDRRARSRPRTSTGSTADQRGPARPRASRGWCRARRRA